MSETSTTDENNQVNSDAANTDNSTDSTSTDTQTAASDNLDETSKSTDLSADGDKSTEDKKADNSTPAFDTDLDDWAEKRFGAKPITDEQRNAYQESRNEQREFTKNQQAKRDTESAKALDAAIKEIQSHNIDDEDESVDPLEKDVRELKARLESQEVSMLQSDFWRANNIDDALGNVMVDVYKEKVALARSPEAKRLAVNYWSSADALSDLHDIAKARVAGGTDTASIAAEEAARQEREKIAKESQANSPGRGAKSTTSGSKTPEQQRLERFSNWD